MSDVETLSVPKRAARRKSKPSIANVYGHSGDLGDIVAALPVIRQLGGGHLILGNRNGIGGREPMTQTRFDVIAPLLLAQPYITGVHFEDNAPTDKLTHDFSDFRRSPWIEGGNLATWQAAYFGITELDQSPWLTAEPSPESEGMAIIARTTRYQDYRFDWREIARRHAGRALFIGLPHEYDAFIKIHEVKPVNLPYRPTENLLEVAQLIAGSDIFYGNQSCPGWISMALAHRTVQETDIYNLNSIVPRDNAVYLSNGVKDKDGTPIWE